MAELLPIKNAADFRAAYSTISSNTPGAILTSRLRNETLQFLSYQAPEKIIAGYSMIGKSDIFDSVAALWPGPATTSDRIKRKLANYVRRRNQIAHEGDYEAVGSVRQMQPSYARECAAFVHNLATRLDRVEYGARVP